MPAVPVALAQEFFTSFRFKATTDLEKESISFILFNREMRISIREWSVKLGLYTADQEGKWFGRDIGSPKNNPEFEQQTVWRLIVPKHVPEYKPTVSRGDNIKDPILRWAQVFLGYNLLSQANTSSTITMAKLYFMWCMKEQRKVHLGYWIAKTCHTITTHPVRHLNVCHILGALVRNNLVLQVDREIPNLQLCPEPELFDLKFFLNVWIVERKGQNLHFYKRGKPDLQVARLAEEIHEESPDEPVVHTERAERLAPAEHVDGWRKRIEASVQTLTHNPSA